MARLDREMSALVGIEVATDNGSEGRLHEFPQ